MFTLDTIPNGLQEIIDTFGHLEDMAGNLVTFKLPYPLLYNNLAVRRATCHAKAKENLLAAFEAIQAAKLETLCLRYGGIYNNRVKRGGSKASTHAWGIAIDLEPEKYPLGEYKEWPPAIMKIMADCGFFWGGYFDGRPDPMHWQLAKGY